MSKKLFRWLVKVAEAYALEYDDQLFKELKKGGLILDFRREAEEK